MATPAFKTATTLTPAIATELMHGAMTGGSGGPTTADFEKFGGHEVISKMYEAAGGQYNPYTEMDPAKLSAVANEIARTGLGNLGVLIATNTPLSSEGAASVARQGHSVDMIGILQDRGVPFAEGALTAARQAEAIVPKVAGRSDADILKIFQNAAKSGNYNFDNLDQWVNAAKTEGLEKALTDFQKSNPGSGSAVTSISKDLGALAAERVLSQTPTSNLPTATAAIPAFDINTLYKPTTFQPQSQPQFQQPLYPTQPQAGLRAALEAPSLVDMSVARPTLTPQAAYLSQIPLVSESVARPTLDAQTSYIDAPAQMRAGGVVGYQEGGMTQYSPNELGSTFDISEYIDPETGRFYINEFQRDVVFNPELREAERLARERMTPEQEAFDLEQMRGRFGLPGALRMVRPFAEGGLASVAQNLADKGRRGDSMLVHMTPDEVAGLQALAQQYGTSLTINPETGLLEANKLKKFARKILPFVAAFAAPYLGPLAATLGVSAPVLAGGLAATGTLLGGGSLEQGIKTGLTAGTGAYLTSGSAGTGGMMGSNPLGVGGESTFNIANTFGAPQTGAIGAESGGVNTTGYESGLSGEEFYGDLSKLTRAEKGLTQVPQTIVGSGAGAGTAAAKTAGMGIDPITGTLLAMTAYGGGKGLEESKEQQRLYDQQMEAQAAERRRIKGAGYDAYARSGLASIPMAGGGMVAMAGGGMTYMEAGGTTGPTGLPRDVAGTGDGMSDSVPATIEGVQEARLADGEFVIPADVVADIGNGSSDAGSKKLYDMMDRIRKARHGTTEQPPEINAEKLMPA